MSRKPLAHANHATTSLFLRLTRCGARRARNGFHRMYENSTEDRESRRVRPARVSERVLKGVFIRTLERRTRERVLRFNLIDPYDTRTLVLRTCPRHGEAESCALIRVRFGVASESFLSNVHRVPPLRTYRHIHIHTHTRRPVNTLRGGASNVVMIDTTHTAVLR